jgi:hypothetical protein
MKGSSSAAPAGIRDLTCLTPSIRALNRPAVSARLHFVPLDKRRTGVRRRVTRQIAATQKLTLQDGQGLLKQVDHRAGHRFSLGGVRGRQRNETYAIRRRRHFPDLSHL